jgi:hypothetical protein
VPDHKTNGKQHYLWRAVDQDGEVVDVYLQAKRADVYNLSYMLFPFVQLSKIATPRLRCLYAHTNTMVAMR